MACRKTALSGWPLVVVGTPLERWFVVLRGIAGRGGCLRGIAAGSSSCGLRRIVWVVGLLDVACGLRLCARGVILRALGQAVFVYRALALAQDVVNLSDVDVAPYLNPLRVEIAAERRAERVCRRLIILLVEVGLAGPEMRQRIRGLDIECVLIFLNGLVVPPERGQRLSTRDGRADSKFRARLQEIIIGIDGNAAWFRTTEGLQLKLGRRAGHKDFLDFRIALGIDLDVHRHAKRVELLMELADHLKTLGRAVGGVLHGELGNAGGIEPLREE